jgi:hypothetical protein
LPMPNFRVAISGQSDCGRLTVRFSTLISKHDKTSDLKTPDLKSVDLAIPESSRHRKSRLWRGARTAWPRLFYI